MQTKADIEKRSDKQKEQFYEQAKQEAVLMSSVIECLEERHVYLKENDKYFKKYHTKMAATLQQEIEAATKILAIFYRKQDLFMICMRLISPPPENIGCQC